MQCRCGQTMNLLLRTVVYSQKVKVNYVPVFCCPDCKQHNAIHPAVKQHLKMLIAQLGERPGKQTLYFQDTNEFAKLLYRASSAEYDDSTVNDIIHIRVNELLDLLSIAESVNDPGWVGEIHDRLDQISDVSRTLNEWNV